MANKHESWIKDDGGHIIGKDTVYYKENGSSVTVHQKADGGGLIYGPSASKITGITYNHPDGTSTNVPK